MIHFIEHPVGGYRERTIENVRQASVTIAIARDFNTAGERLTKNACTKLGASYFPINIAEGFQSAAGYAFEVASMMDITDRISVNFAGNGIYSLREYGQDRVDEWVQSLLLSMTDFIKVVAVRSGGQTGIDEAGAKAGDRLGILTTVLAPKGWLFRDIHHVDHSSEHEFKKRFF